jgi:protein-L-isoaspartate(D-aspartate) O-methyltransferase
MTRVSEDELREENLGGVSFVPLLGEQGWPASD